MANKCTSIQKSLGWCQGTPELPGVKRRILDNLTHCPLCAIHAVEFVSIEQYHSRTILVHERVIDIAVLVHHLLGDNLVGLDISRLGFLRHPNIDLIEPVFARSSHNCFECCHLRL